ncbi:MAG: helix-turn-helix domain-containing protein [Ruminococcus sp.]|nr:helix-turn-helix domain-containing protein [Ruminococcus sp.]
MTFGQKIKTRREELGYTQAELAKRVHTTQPYVSRLERGWFNP